MTVLLSVVAALLYGLSDFAGGVASRRRPAITILLTAYPVGALVMIACLPLLPGTLSLAVTLYGIGGGLAGMLGVVLMYSALARGPMSVISPVTAVLAAIVPVTFGVLVGERPAAAAWVGIAIGLVAVYLVSRTPSDHPTGPLATPVLIMAIVAGAGFGVYFICLGHAPSDSGAWPVVISRITSGLLIVPLAWRTDRVAALHGRLLLVAVLIGVTDASANLFFLLAARDGLLAIASVITSLYPAATVLLAGVLLHERTGPLQRVGLGLAAIAVVLITVSA